MDRLELTPITTILSDNRAHFFNRDTHVGPYTRP